MAAQFTGTSMTGYGENFYDLIEDAEERRPRRETAARKSLGEFDLDDFNFNAMSMYAQALTGVRWIMAGMSMPSIWRNIGLTDSTNVLLKQPLEDNNDISLIDACDRMSKQSYISMFEGLKHAGNRVELNLVMTRSHVGEGITVMYLGDEVTGSLEEFYKVIKPLWGNITAGGLASWKTTHQQLKNNKVFADAIIESGGNYETIPEFEPYEDAVDIEYIFTIKRPEGAYAGNVSTSTPEAFVINVVATIKLPIELMLHVQKVEKTSDLSKALSYIWFTNAAKEWVRVYRGAWPAIAIHPKASIEALTRSQRMAKGWSPRVNKGGWAVDEYGAPRRFPSAAQGQRLVDYVNKLDVLFDKLERATSVEERNALQAEISQLPKKEIAGKTLLVDWVNDHLITATVEGEIAISFLHKYRAMSESAQERFLRMPIRHQRIKDDFLILTSRLIESNNSQRGDFFTSIGVSGGELYASPQQKQDADARYGNMSWVQQTLISNSIISDTLQIEVRHLCGLDLNEFEDVENQRQRDDILNAIAMFRKIVIAAYPKRDEINKDLSEVTTDGTYGWLFETVATMTPDRRQEIRRVVSEDRKRLSPTPLGDTLEIPNVRVAPGKFEGVMPHQKEALSVLASQPKYAIIGVDAGGGKTIIGLLTLILKLTKGAKKPLVLAPPRLVVSGLSETNVVSGGRINAFDLRLSSLRTMFKACGITTFEQAVQWLKDLPANCIFYAGYENLASTTELVDPPQGVPLPQYFTYDGSNATFQYALLLAAAGFDTVILDESHFIKNQTSRRHRTTAYVCSRADTVYLMSGTVGANRIAVDLHGQMSMIDPSILGSFTEYSNEFQLSADGSSGFDNPENNRKLMTKIRQDVAYLTHKRSEWSYLLPKLESDFAYAKMTSLQSQFYQLLMVQAMQRFNDMIKKKAKKKGGKVNGGAVAEVLDNMMEDDTNVEAILRSTFARVEQFLIAPEDDRPSKDDENYSVETADDDTDGEDSENGNVASVKTKYGTVVAAYANWEKNPRGDDLISPKVKTTDDIIDQLMADKNRKGKILVFFYHKCGSRHFMKYSRHARNALHYMAGADDIIDRIKNDDTVQLAVCDETSLAIGQNLQMCDVIIRQQTLWTPGAFEQAIARIYRPDPRSKYDHQSVKHIWVIAQLSNGDATIDTAKTARFFSKAYYNSEFEFSTDDRTMAAWAAATQNVDDLKPLKMSIELLQDFRNEDAVPYFEAWRSLQTFLQGRNKAVMRQMAEKIKAMHGVDLLNPDGTAKNKAEFLSYVITPVVEAKQPIAGSKRVYTPWPLFGVPPDPFEIGVTTVDDETLQEGKVLWTEFGPAVVLDASTANDRNVKIMAAHGEIRLPRGRVAIATTTAGQKKLNDMLKSAELMSKYVLLPPGAKVSAPFKKKYNVIVVDNDKRTTVTHGDDSDDHSLTEPNKKKAPELTQPKKPVKLDFPISLMAITINGMPAQIIPDSLPELKNMKTAGGWVETGEFVAIGFQNAKAAEAFIDYLDGKFYLSPDRKELLESELEKIRGQIGKMRVTELPRPKDLRNFFLETHRKGRAVNGKYAVNPMWLFWGSKVRLVFSTDGHDAAFISWLKSKAKSRPGVVAVKKVEPMWVNFFRSVSEAVEDAKALREQLKALDMRFDEKAFNEEMQQVKALMAKVRKGKDSSKK